MAKEAFTSAFERGLVSFTVRSEGKGDKTKGSDVLRFLQTRFEGPLSLAQGPIEWFVVSELETVLLVPTNDRYSACFCMCQTTGRVAQIHRGMSSIRSLTFRVQAA